MPNTLLGRNPPVLSLFDYYHIFSKSTNDVLDRFAAYGFEKSVPNKILIRNFIGPIMLFELKIFPSINFSPLKPLYK